MSDKNPPTSPPGPDIPTLEADMAFFEARLSLAGHAPDTAYQRAQIKTYETLGRLLGAALESTRQAPTTAGQGEKKRG